LSLEKLRLWSTDEQIMQTIHHSHQLALELTEFLDMIRPADLSITANNSLIIISSHEKEVSKSYIHNETSDNGIQEEDNLSSAINNASREIGRNDNLDNNTSPINIFQNGQMQLNIFNEPCDSLSILNNGDSGNYEMILF
jgi:hypothetical protein